jgi:asparagine synthase (glutamine-hydrolysing)
MGQWIVKELREVVADYLSEGRLRQRGIFEATAVSDIVAQHGQGQRDFSLHIWALLVLEEWMRQQEEWQRG